MTDITRRALDRLVFFLGGTDLEMLTIRALLEETIPGRFHDKHLAWGAKASAYGEEIREALDAGKTPVLVELEDDLGLDPEAVVIADHHGERAGSDKPTSLHQIFALLGLPAERWTRWFELVAANDRGHIAELVKIGATLEEIAKVRAADRAAQGITEEDELAGARALASAEILAGGKLTVVRLPHNRAAVVTDRLAPALRAAGYANLLVVSLDEVNFYGAGNIISALNDRFPDGWYGGALPERGFWGRTGPSEEVERYLIGSFLEARLQLQLSLR